jgi:AcrR family transcriptional regulator
MTNKTAPKRQRLQPEERKNQILDVAATLIREHGVSALNMDRLGREAGVSKPLVYNYFPNRTDLLKSLLLREVRRYHHDSASIAASTGSLEELVRATSRKMLEYVSEFGIVIQQLMLEPEVADVLEHVETHYESQHADYLSKRVQQEYGIDLDVARAAIEIGLGLSTAGGAYMEKHNADMAFVEDMLTAMIMGSLERSAARSKAGKIRMPGAAKATAAE